MPRFTEQPFALVLTMVGSWASAASLPPAPPPNDYVEATMRQWAVPGLAIAVVKDGEVVFSQGYGVKQAERSEPVDENTIFEIGSMTKSFTTAAAAILVDEGKLRWEGPVTSYLPSFQFSDPWITAHATLEDIAAHRVGIDANIVWNIGNNDLDSVLHRVRYLAPANHFGEFLYSNTGMMTVGKIVERASGKSWQELFETRLFAPLSMTRSSTDRESYIPRENLAPCWLCTAPGAAKLGLDALAVRERNVAVPHGLSVRGNRPPGEARRVEVWPWRNDHAGPAGAVNSTARDMAQWLIMQIDQGRYKGKRVISPDQAQRMHSAHVLMQSAGEEDASHYGRSLVNFGYGYGWSVGIYRGHAMISHSGGQVGFGSHMLFFPGERVGVVVLQNVDYRDSNLPLVVARRFADYYLGIPPLDWNAYEAGQWSRKHESREQYPDEDYRPTAFDKKSAERYLGDYENPAIGMVSVLLDEGMLMLKIDTLCKADIYMSNPQDGALVFRSADRSQMSISFTRGKDGTASGLVLGKNGGEILPLVLAKVRGRPTSATGAH